MVFEAKVGYRRETILALANNCVFGGLIAIFVVSECTFSSIGGRWQREAILGLML
jgi:hypothetical protein